MNFGINDLKNVSGLSRRTIHRWQAEQIIRRVHSAGRRPEYSWSTALGCALAGAMIRAGVRTAVASRVIDWCESGQLHRRVMEGHHYLVCTRQQIFIARDGAMFAAKRGDDLVAITIDLPQAIRIFNAAVERESAAIAESN